MASLYDVINDIIGDGTDTTGFFYSVNHSNTATAGAGATHDLTIRTKLEGTPLNHIDDEDLQLPAVFFDTVGAFPSAYGSGAHYETVFSVRVYYLDKATVGEVPKQSARKSIAKLTDNIMASNKLGLSWIDCVDWRGFDDDNDVTRFLGIVLQDYIAASTRFEIRAGVTF